MDIDIADFKRKLEMMMKDAGPNSVIMMDPQILEKLYSSGDPSFVMMPTKTPKEIVADIYEQRKLIALELADKIPLILDKTRPSIQTLHDEIRECIYFGQYGAAITLCGILVEYTLKYVTYCWDIPERSIAFDCKKWDDIVEGTLFEGAINKALGMQIISGTESEALKAFKNAVRNPYSHYNIRKLVKDVIVPSQRMDVGKNAIETVENMAGEDPAFFHLAKKWIDDKSVAGIYRITYHNVRVLLTRLNVRQSAKEER